MTKFIIDSQNPLYKSYKKLIKLPNAHYLLTQSDSSYTINNSTKTIDIINKLTLKLKDGKIVLHYEGSPLQNTEGEDFVIEQNDIIGKDKANIISALLNLNKTVGVASEDIASSNGYAIGLSIYIKAKALLGVLNFINFNDENDPVLQKIKQDNKGLYFTAEEDGKDYTVCISDQHGTCTSGIGAQYQYTIPNTNDELTIVGSLTNQVLSDKCNETKKFAVKITKGAEISDGKYEAKIELDGKGVVGALSSIGHYFHDNKIYLYDHFAKNKEGVSLPRNFHFLKVVKTEEDGYKLVFCNQYGHEYYAVPDDCRLISIGHIKGIKNINPVQYHDKNGSYPSFFVKASNKNYTGSEQYEIDVYETSNAKAKVGSLIDTFCYYDIQDKFHYVNRQLGEQHYHSPSFTITRGDNQCQLHKMKVNGTDHSFLNDTMDCSLVEHMANHVNDLI